MRVVRGVSGIVTGGVVALTLLVVGAGILGRVRGFPGPGGSTMSWHVGAAVVVLGAQWQADRKRGPVAVGAAVLIVTIAAVLLWTQWWR